MRKQGTIWARIGRTLLFPFRLIWRVLGWLMLPYIWLANMLGGFLRAGWAGTERWRTKRKRRFISQWRVIWARWRTRMLWRRPPKDAILAPIIPNEPQSNERRLSPLFSVTAISSVLLLAAATYYVAVIRPRTETPLIQSIAVVNTPTLTPTATSTPTPTHTPTPTPIIIQLTPWPTPDPLAGGGSIAFELRRNGNPDIYALSIGNSEPLRLTDHDTPDRNPAWRPDGRMLAFDSDRSGNGDIYVLDVPTGQVIRLTNHPGYDGNPSWSPDGQWIVYESYDEGNLDLYILKRDRSQGPVRITEHAAADFDPVWSPDGRFIAYVSYRTGNRDIFLMSLDQVGDSQALNLTETFDRDEIEPAFHSQGSHLAFTEITNGIPLLQAVPLNLDAGGAAGPPLSLGQGRQPAWAPIDNSVAYIFNLEERDFLIASTLGAWAVAPQTFTTDGRLSHPDWSAVALAREPADYLSRIANLPEQPLYTETVSRTTSFDPPFELVTIDINAPLPFLNSQVDQSFLALQERVIAETGWNVMANMSQMFEQIDAQPLPGLPLQTWHKTGRAFDLDPEVALLLDPQVEVMRRDDGAETSWEIFIRAAEQNGSLGRPLREKPWDFRARFGSDPAYFDQGGRYKDEIPSGYYVNFTELARDYGWVPVPADRNWRTFYPGVRYWQFEKRDGLNWEAAMREIYTEAELEAAGFAIEN